MGYKYKLTENPLQIGDTETKQGTTYKVTDIDPTTGAITWDVSDAPQLDTSFNKLKSANKLLKQSVPLADDEVITQLSKELNTIFNKYRYHLRKNYPEVYSNIKGELDEISTSAGAGGYLTKYAFKLPKNFKKVKESLNPGATLGPGPKAGGKGVKDNLYVKKFGYKLVDRKKQAKSSKTMDYRDLWGNTYK